MSGKTPRFGFNWFDGDSQTGSFGDDGQKFSGTDRLMIDRLLAAIEQHDHSADSETDDAPDGPTLAYDSTGGALEAGLTYYYKATFVDARGLESDASDEVSVALPDLLDAPDAPGAGTATSGSLTPGLYYYALTAVRGSEESAQGDTVPVTVLADEHEVDLTMPALGSATSFRVWRMSDAEGFWRKFPDVVAGSTFTDDGTGTPTATDAPTANTGVATYAVTVTLQTADATAIQAAAVSGWKVYRSTTSGTYGGNSLVHYVTEREDDLDPLSDRLSVWTDTGDALLPGAPPVSASKMHFAELSTGGGGGGFTVLGAWDSAPTYSAGDIVTRYGSHYRALQAVPTAQDPWLNPATAAGDLGATDQTTFDVMYYTVSAQTFTVGATDMLADTLSLKFGDAASGAGTGYVGIATALNTTLLAGPTWLVSPIATAFGTDTDVVVSLGSAVTLTAGATYYIVVYSDVDSSSGNWFMTHSVTHTGDIASLGTLYNASGNTDPWAAAPSGYAGIFTLSRAVGDPYWAPLTPTLKGIYNGSAVYALGEFVQYGTALWRCLTDQLSGSAPTAGSDWEVVAYVVPTGGTTGQVLTKASSTDGDYGWV